MNAKGLPYATKIELFKARPILFFVLASGKF